MDMIIYIVYPLLAVALLWGCKIYGPKKWNDEFLSLKQTKAIQGFCAVCIMLHHCGQKTCMPGMKEQYVKHGLDVFVPIGYFFVAIFLFCSGYGLYKSYKTKPGYLKNYPENKLVSVLYTLLISSFIFAIARVSRDEVLWFTNPFTLGGPRNINPYAWYVYAFVFFGLVFYLTFYNISNERLAIGITTIAVVAYMWHCDFWMYGNWWINSSALFIIGLMVARHEEKLVPHLKKLYILYLILAIIGTGVFFALGEYTTEILGNVVAADSYTFFRLVRLFSQILAAIFFTAMVFLIGMKLRVGNKFLAFMGSITLEFYLLHGIFVQGFGYAFLDEALDPFYYIKNVALYVAVVFVLGVILAFIVQKICKKSLQWLSERDYVFVIFGGIKFILIGAAIVVVVLGVYWTAVSHNQTKEVQAELKKYSDEYITYVNVDGKQMATTVMGEGDHTIVILPSFDNYCPTMTFRGLSKWLAEDYRVVVLDYFGTGFSDDTDAPRDSVTISKEVHEALVQLGIEGTYILMPNGISGIYAYKYIELYRDEVEAYIGMFANMPNMFEEEMRMNNSRMEDVVRSLDKQGKFRRNWSKVLAATGLIRLETPSYVDIFSSELSELERDVLDEVIVSNVGNMAFSDELNKQPDNYAAIRGYKLPEDLPTMYMLDKATDSQRLYHRLSWRDMYDRTITNKDLQYIEYIDGSSYVCYYDPLTVAKRVKYFMEDYIDVAE